MSESLLCHITALEQSGLIEQLLQIIGEDVGAFGATEVTLTLDGLARLRQQPSSILLDALAKQVRALSMPHLSNLSFFCSGRKNITAYRKSLELYTLDYNMYRRCSN